MRIVACITQAAVINQILTHLRKRAKREAHTDARGPPLNPGHPGEKGQVTRAILILKA